jgi:ribose-phosphate pyrophosphokinase
MKPVVLAGSATPSLAASVAARLGVDLLARTIERFPDEELHVALQGPIVGDDVFVVQSTCPPVDAHVVELALLVDACRRAGAGRITAVVPYFGYARQDRRSAPGEPIAAATVARLLDAVRANRMLVVDPHSAGLEAMFDCSFEALSAVPVLAAALRPSVPPHAILVAPDLGAAKLAERYAAVLDLPVAVVRKHRISGEAVRAVEIVGDIADRVPVIVDDMISTGGTIEAAVRLATAAGAEPRALVAATHGLFVGPSVARLRALGLRALFVTDSVPRDDIGLAMQVVPIDDLVASAIMRLRQGESLGDLAFYR